MKLVTSAGLTYANGMVSQAHLFYLRKFSKKLSVRAAAFGVLAVAAALIAVAFAPFVPEEWSKVLGSDAVDGVLTIIASSMLAVVTFSLSTMVAAYASASSSVTPRASRILMEDRRSQNALSMFLGSFIFSVVALAALSTGYYGPGGRVILFGFTVVLIIAIVMTIIRWIEEISKLGRVHETLRRIEAEASKALVNRARAPLFHCKSCDVIPDQGAKVCSTEIGYVQSLDLEKMNQIASKLEREFFICAQPGAFVHLNTPLVRCEDSASLSEAEATLIRDTFVIGPDRTFEEDPRFGLIVLSEVASRALSPAVNDPGTAISVIGSQVRLLSSWVQIQREGACQVQHPWVRVQKLRCQDLVEDAFRPLSRDGASQVEVLMRLVKALEALMLLNDPEMTEAAKAMQREVLERAKRGLALPGDLDQLDGLLKTQSTAISK